MSYDWVLLDADGTLFDYERAEAVTLSMSLEQIGVSFREEHLAAYRKINAAAWEAFERGEIDQLEVRRMRFVELFKHFDIASDPAAFDRLYLDTLSQQAYLVDGAEGLLDSLFGCAGLALLTNGIPHVQRSRLRRSKLGRYFRAVVISGEVGVAKPDPRIFEIAQDAIGRPSRSRILMVGDSLTSDIQGGVNAGIDTCWYNPGRAPSPSSPTPTHQIVGLAALIPIVCSEPAEAGAPTP